MSVKIRWRERKEERWVGRVCTKHEVCRNETRVIAEHSDAHLGSHRSGTGGRRIGSSRLACTL